MIKKFLSLTHYAYILLASPLKKKKIGSPKKKRRSRSSSTEMKNKRSLVGFIYTFSSLFSSLFIQFIECLHIMRDLGLGKICVMQNQAFFM